MLRPPPFRPKPRRLPKMKRMTLVASVRCGSSVVLGADSLEAVGDVKTSVKKIVPRFQVGRYDLAFAGAGNGLLVDDFERRIQEDLRTCSAVSQGDLRSA